MQVSSLSNSFFLPKCEDYFNFFKISENNDDDTYNFGRKNYHRKKTKLNFVRWYLTGDFLHLGIWLILRHTYAAVPIAGGDLSWLDRSLRIWITTVSELVSVQFCLASFSSHGCNSYSVFLAAWREQEFIQILHGLSHIEVSSLILLFYSSSDDFQVPFCIFF